MDINRLKNIFIEEASEIIEKLDIDIVNLEESPDDKDLLNELFRGVHTLKGSANSFGFTRLGKFVHAFEDVLDFYRNSNTPPDSSKIDIFLEAVDMIKDIFESETGEESSLPDGYDHLLEELHGILESKESTDTGPIVHDIVSEFGDSDEQQENDAPEEGEKLFMITIKADTDLYIRGQDHNIFLKNLADVSQIKESFWQYKDIPELKELDTAHNYLYNMDIFTASESQSDVEEVFEFIDEEEWSIADITHKKTEVKKEERPAKEPEPEQKPEETKPEKAEKKIHKPEPEPAAAAKGKEVKKEEKRSSFIKIDTAKLDELFDSIGELVVAQNSLAENKIMKSIDDEIMQKTIESLTKITRLVQNRVMSLRMVPIRDTFEKMRRVVRDATRKVNKEVKLHISGEETEIDKTMVDSLSDPLIHILRNSVDHGIEATAKDREENGKEQEGNVHLSAYHKGGTIVIEIKDDGRGIDAQKVYKKALDKGLVAENEELSDQQIYALIMQPGFSTADQISDISGRGVGLDVVRTSIENLRGKIEIDSEPGKGTKFCIYLPLTLAIIDGMLVETGGEVFILPTLSIIESFRPTEEMIHKAEGKGEFVKLREEFLPIIRLNRVLELTDSQKEPWECTLVCSESEKGKFALMVDDLIGRQQVVIKPLGKVLSHLKEISGGAVMGNGEIALILNIEGIY